MKSNLLIFLVLTFFVACHGQVTRGELTVQNIEIFKNTDAWDLIQAVDDNDVTAIQNILDLNRELVDFQDSIFGTTPLMWAVGAEKYDAAKVLLENGADPNLISKTGATALFRAISFSWYDSNADPNSKFVKLLLDSKADPNIPYCSPKVEGETAVAECGTSPLMHAVSRGFGKVKLLVGAGANVDYKTKSGRTAAFEALLMEDVDAAYFLILEHKAVITEPVYFYSLTEADSIDITKPHYPVDLLLDWTFELNSSNYKKKKAIIMEFSRQGVSYEDRKSNISDLIIRKIQGMHPNDWKEYIKAY